MRIVNAMLSHLILPFENILTFPEREKRSGKWTVVSVSVGNIRPVSKNIKKHMA